MKDLLNKIGILDPDGINPNPLNNQPYSSQYKDLAKIWSKYPAYETAPDIIKQLEKNQVSLIISGTGSGKTVLTPKYVLHLFDYTGKIGISLPKQIIAQSAAEFAAKTLDVELGKEVGYKFKGSDTKYFSKENRLAYMTDGTIVSLLLKDPLLSDYDAIIVDEVHERKVQIDFLLYLLKNVCKARKEFKLILMSATINEELFKAYYAENNFGVINIGGKTNFPIDSYFLDSTPDSKEYLDKGYDILKKIIKEDDITKSGAHDIIFFITSVSEAEKMCIRLNSDAEIKEFVKSTLCIEVYSGMPADLQELAQSKDLFKEKYPDKRRKVIFATNVAESSLTIDGIKYVIDGGLELFSYFDPEKRAKILDRKLITHAQAKQRMGRGGRTGPGVCYHLYTKQDFDANMQRFPEPTIRVSDILGECLRLLAQDNIQTFTNLTSILSQFIEPPREKYIRYVYNTMIKYNIIQDDKITKLGLLLSDLPIDPILGIACIVAKKMVCLSEVISIIALLDAGKSNMNNFFNNPTDIMQAKANNSSIKDQDKLKSELDYLSKKFNKAKDSFASKFGDHTALLKIFTKYYDYFEKDNRNKMQDFSYSNFLNSLVWEKACIYYKRINRQIRQTLQIIEHDYSFKEINISTKIMGSFNYALRYNIATVKNNNIKVLSVDDPNVKVKINDNSYLAEEKFKNSQELIYQELISTFGKFEINVISKINDSTKKIVNLLDKK